jgi:hypothetical protein
MGCIESKTHHALEKRIEKLESYSALLGDDVKYMQKYLKHRGKKLKSKRMPDMHMDDYMTDKSYNSNSSIESPKTKSSMHASR